MECSYSYQCLLKIYIISIDIRQAKDNAISQMEEVFMICLQKKNETPVSRLRQKAENGGFLSKGQEQTLEPSLMDRVGIAKGSRKWQVEAESLATTKQKEEE